MYPLHADQQLLPLRGVGYGSTFAGADGRVMLRQLSEEIAECYRRAGEARERAKEISDPALKQDFLDLEGRWLFLARSYEFTQRLTDFNGDLKRRPKPSGK